MPRELVGGGHQEAIDTYLRAIWWQVMSETDDNVTQKYKHVLNVLVVTR